MPDARGHPPGRLRGERGDDDPPRPRDVGRRDAALVPRRDDGQLLCEPRVHAIDATRQNLHSRAGEDDECRALHPHLPEKPDASLSLGTLTLKDPWETVLFNDRALKHEVEAFDGDRPCSRCVIVQLTRKPLKDGTDTMLRDGSLVTLE